MEIAMVDADVAEDFAVEFTALPQERQKRLVFGISVEHWEHVVIAGLPGYMGLRGGGLLILSSAGKLALSCSI